MNHLPLLNVECNLRKCIILKGQTVKLLWLDKDFCGFFLFLGLMYLYWHVYGFTLRFLISLHSLFFILSLIYVEKKGAQTCNLRFVARSRFNKIKKYSLLALIFLCCYIYINSVQHKLQIDSYCLHHHTWALIDSRAVFISQINQHVRMTMGHAHVQKQAK